MLKISVAQLNLTIGDIPGNLREMLSAALLAYERGADIVAFPELSLTGYYPGDLLDELAFRNATETGLAELRMLTKRTPGLAWVVGAPLPAAAPGKKLTNSLLVIQDGLTLLSYAKQLLPTYNIFDERRHFEPGPEAQDVLRIKGHTVGFLICEDGWNLDGTEYAVNPLKSLSRAAPDVVVSINASPSNVGKREQRHELFVEAATRFNLPIIYVNHVGGHDQLVFDGASFAVTPSQGICYEAPQFKTALDMLYVDSLEIRSLDNSVLFPDATPRGLSRMEFYRQQIVLGLKDYARRCGFKQAVVGCSGGIDSALTIALAAEALGASNVMAITMPSAFSSEGSVTDSEALCTNLGVPLLRHPIRDIVVAYGEAFAKCTGAEPKGLTLENLQARIRGTILMEYSNAHGHLLLTTGNKSEISVGYFTLYGDSNGGLNLIGDLYKTEVFQLARHLNLCAGRTLIPEAIIEKAPSAELAPGQQDTDSLPPYELLDEILKVLIEGERLSSQERDLCEKVLQPVLATLEGQQLFKKIETMIARNEYKRRQAPPILRMRSRAFGSGRQMPIAAVHCLA